MTHEAFFILDSKNTTSCLMKSPTGYGLRASMALFRSISEHIFSSVFYICKPISYTSSAPPLSMGTLVVDAVSILKNHRSKSRWSYLRSLFTSTEDARLHPSHFSEIAIQIRNNPHLALRFFDFTLHHSLCAHSLSSYATIIHILSRSRMKSHALTVIKSAMRTFSEDQQQSTATPLAILEALIKTYRVCDSAPFVFDLLVKACIESKKIDLALEIYSLLKSKNVFLKTSTCNSLIELVSKSQGSFAGYDLYTDIFCFECYSVGRNGKRKKRILPNANTLNMVMIGFYREGLLEKVEEVWEELARVGCERNIYSFNVLMAAYCNYGRMDDAMRVWEEISSKGFSHDAVSYNTIISGFCRLGDINRAEEIYREMVMKGVGTTRVTFDHLINAYSEVGDADSARMLYKDMLRKGCTPENSTVNAVVKSLCDKNETCTAFQIWRMAEKQHGAVLEGDKYEKLIRGLCREGMMEEALKLQSDMVVKGHEMSSEIYAVFVDGYVRQGNETMAAKLTEEMFCKEVQ